MLSLTLIELFCILYISTLLLGFSVAYNDKLYNSFLYTLTFLFLIMVSNVSCGMILIELNKLGLLN